MVSGGTWNETVIVTLSSISNFSLPSVSINTHGLRKRKYLSPKLFRQRTNRPRRQIYFNYQCRRSYPYTYVKKYDVFVPYWRRLGWYKRYLH